MFKTVTAAIFALTLAISLNASAQQPDLSGKHHIRASGKTDGKGAYLHVWTHGQVVADSDYKETTFEIIKVGDDTRKGKEAGLYHLKQHDGHYLCVKDGKIFGDKKAPSKDAQRWIVWDNGGGYSILFYDDDQKGANAVSFVSKDSGATVEKPNADGRYAIALTRNNAGGRGMQHQLWEVTKE
jgi:hypothetical protein